MPERSRGATYRLQLHREFGFDQAAAIADYLKRLGISHLYTSPYFQALPGSMHGYDVVDHARVNSELGGEAGHQRLMEALEHHGLGHVIDVVPNHMSIAGRGNGWWWDVLEHGPSSRYARYFDVDWDSPEERLRNMVLLPVLGDHYGRELEAGKIRLEREGDRVVVRYADHVFPVNTRDVDVSEVNADIEKLHDLLERQNYRLAWWQTAGRDLGYRRFFDVNSLIALCAEEDDVFRDTHRLVFQLVRSGMADGLRIDHPDGLRDPETYLARLHDAFPGTWVVVEKILEPGEDLPESWPVAGTTGYEFLNLAGGLFIDGDAEPALNECYTAFTGESTDWAAVARDRKMQVLRDVLGSDVSRLAELLLRVCERHRRHRDYSRHQITDALRELLACFPVYRTYARPATGFVSETDRRAVVDAVARAKERQPDLDVALFDFVESLLTLRSRGDLEDAFVQRFQQLCGPATAKGVEDTAFYVYNRFVAANEVGGDPGRLGTSVSCFHQAMRHRLKRYPEALLATATHDTKRGEDVRARLYVLSECADEWGAAVRQWSRLTDRYRSGELPDPNAVYLFYQTLVGAWPLDAERAAAYMEKASREAKVHTSWLTPNDTYDAALRRFVEGSMADERFIADVSDFVARNEAGARTNSLGMLLLKMTAPGVPDFYQGTELWSHVLVDPDNRRSVDYDLRRALLEEVRGLDCQAAMGRIAEGVPKMWLMQRTLALRAERAAAFGRAGSYEALEAEGSRAAHIVAFARGGEVVTVVPRLSRRVNSDWGDTAVPLPKGKWRNVLDAARYEGRAGVAGLLARFPVALLALESSGPHGLKS